MTASDKSQVDTSETFTDNSVLLDYSLDGTENAEELFDVHTSVGKVTSRFGHDEYEGVKDRRRQFAKDVKDLVKDDVDPAEIEVSSFNYLSRNDEGYAEELLRELIRDIPDDRLIQRLNEERDRLKIGYNTLFEEPQPLVTVKDVSSSKQKEKLCERLFGIVSNGNDRNLLGDATEWHKNGGSGTFISTDKDDIVGKNEGNKETESSSTEGLALTFEEFAATEDTIPEQINNEIKVAYSEELTLDLLTTEEFLEILDKQEPIASEK